MSEPLFASLLGSVWAELPCEIRLMHRLDGVASGRASVERGRGWLARATALVIRLPNASADTPISVRFKSANGIQTWTRNFGGTAFSSRLFAGQGRWEHLLCEKFGGLTFAMALVHDGDRLRMILRQCRVFGFALPMWLCPRSDTYETVADGRFQFHVEISHPFTGLIVRYKGWLTPDPPPNP